MIKRPMLACNENVTLDDLQSLQYPIYGTPKFDGIRMLIIKQRGVSVGVSRKLKPIPNYYIQSWIEKYGLPSGLDGEIIIEGMSFNDIQSKVMRAITLPFRFKYMVFDDYHIRGDYLTRIAATKLHRKVCAPELKYVMPQPLRDAEHVQVYEQQKVDAGYEGIILRSGDGPYKEGRSTRKEGYMLKMKRFTDCEGRIVGMEEKLRNENEKTVDALGYSKRSTHKANKFGAGTMGKLFVLSEGKRVTLGGGWDAAFAKDVFTNYPKYHGLTVTYKKQTHGEKDNPRIATFKGIRYD